MKNRKREICTSGSARGEGGNILTYSAAPHAVGPLPAPPGGTTIYSKFPSYADSLKSFVAIAGSLVQGKSDPAAFAAALQNSGKFGVYKNGAKVPTYVPEVAATIRGLSEIVGRRTP